MYSYTWKNYWTPYQTIKPNCLNIYPFINIIHKVQLYTIPAKVISSCCHIIWTVLWMWKYLIQYLVSSASFFSLKNFLKANRGNVESSRTHKNTFYSFNSNRHRILQIFIPQCCCKHLSKVTCKNYHRFIIWRQKKPGLSFTVSG